MSDELKGRIGLRAFFKIAEAWSLSEEDEAAILGLSNHEMLRAWKASKGPDVSDETLMRISYVLGIYRALNTLLPRKNVADAWIRQPNAAPIFGDRTALEMMTDGAINSLKIVRQYLDAEAPPLAYPDAL